MRVISRKPPHPGQFNHVMVDEDNRIVLTLAPHLSDEEADEIMTSIENGTNAVAGVRLTTKVKKRSLSIAITLLRRAANRLMVEGKEDEAMDLLRDIEDLCTPAPLTEHEIRVEMHNVLTSVRDGIVPLEELQRRARMVSSLYEQFLDGKNDN